MKGANADPSKKMMTVPKARRSTTSGISHHFFSRLKNEIYSLKSPIFNLLTGWDTLSADIIHFAGVSFLKSNITIYKIKFQEKRGEENRQFPFLTFSCTYHTRAYNLTIPIKHAHDRIVLIDVLSINVLPLWR